MNCEIEWFQVVSDYLFDKSQFLAEEMSWIENMPLKKVTNGNNQLLIVVCVSIGRYGVLKSTNWPIAVHLVKSALRTLGSLSRSMLQIHDHDFQMHIRNFSDSSISKPESCIPHLSKWLDNTIEFRFGFFSWKNFTFTIIYISLHCKKKPVHICMNYIRRITMENCIDPNQIRKPETIRLNL